MTKADIDAFSRTFSGGVQIVRKKSSWANPEFMLEVIATLACCLGEEVKRRHVILHMDAHRIHTPVSVLEACSSAGILVHIVPASMTPWLQPLDVSVFSPFKGWVVREIERLRLASPSGSLSKLVILEVYRRGVLHIIQKQDWRHAFEITGLRGQNNLSKRLMARMELSAAPSIPNCLPRYRDFEACFPAGMKIPIGALFKLVLERERLKLALRVPASSRLPRLHTPE